VLAAVKVIFQKQNVAAETTAYAAPPVAAIVENALAKRAVVSAPNNTLYG
jgi:hypothetical protein